MASVLVEVVAVEDDRYEPMETAVLSLNASPAYGFSAPATATVRIADNDYKLKSVALRFDSLGVARDDGSGNYTAANQPQWWDADANGKIEDSKKDAQGNPLEWKHPLNYVRSVPGSQSKVTLTASFQVEGTLAAGDYTLHGEGGGMDQNTTLTFDGTITLNGLQAGGTLSFSGMASAALKEVIDNGDLSIQWTLSGGGAQKRYTSNANHMYVTGVAADGAFETVLDIGCSSAKGKRPRNPGEVADPASGQDPGLKFDREVVDAVWGKFASLAVSRVSDGKTMLYNHHPDRGMTMADMLGNTNANGQCTAWAELMVAVLGAQGVGANVREIRPKADYDGFRVSKTTGQGNSNPETEFQMHQVVKVAAYPDWIFDPSYGGLPTKPDHRISELRWEDENVTHERTVTFLPGTWINDHKGTQELRFNP